MESMSAVLNPSASVVSIAVISAWPQCQLHWCSSLSRRNISCIRVPIDDYQSELYFHTCIRIDNPFCRLTPPFNFLIQVQVKMESCFLSPRRDSEEPDAKLCQLVHLGCVTSSHFHFNSEHDPVFRSSKRRGSRSRRQRRESLFNKKDIGRLESMIRFVREFEWCRKLRHEPV